MTDLDAILARHVPLSPPNYKPYEPDVCKADRQEWPCDAHQLGVALEATREALSLALRVATELVEGDLLDSLEGGPDDA